jgi:hypothetical protein
LGEKALSLSFTQRKTAAKKGGTGSAQHLYLGFREHALDCGRQMIIQP